MLTWASVNPRYCINNQYLAHTEACLDTRLSPPRRMASHGNAGCSWCNASHRACGARRGPAWRWMASASGHRCAATTAWGGRAPPSQPLPWLRSRRRARTWCWWGLRCHPHPCGHSAVGHRRMPGHVDRSGYTARQAVDGGAVGTGRQLRCNSGLAASRPGGSDSSPAGVCSRLRRARVPREAGRGGSRALGGSATGIAGACARLGDPPAAAQSAAVASAVFASRYRPSLLPSSPS